MGLSRREMYSRLQMLRLMEPLTENALLDRELQIWRGDLDSDDEPHGRPWHTSFHASSFPGGDRACPRKALYTMMNIPRERPANPNLRLTAETGKAVEEAIIWGFHSHDILLSPPPSSPVQMGFTDPECWLTGNCDAVILHPRLKRPHVFECKQKYDDVLNKMRVGLLGPDPTHVTQVKTYISFLNLLSKHFWPDLPELRDGTIYYVSRDRPRKTAEFFVELDEEFREMGRAKLLDWKKWFEEDVLPSQLAGVIPQDRNSKGTFQNSKRHPLGKEWKWGEQPCKWCDYGQLCREDFKNDVTTLSESYAIGHANEIKGGSYDYDDVREAVFAAWEDLPEEVQPAQEIVKV
jgi:hypothetical protein